MAIALGLLVLLAFTVIFHFASPWWFTPLASNWGAMDDTIVLTFWVTGLVFIAISIFMIYCVVKYRHKKGRRATYEPEHKTLEIGLMVLTTIGIVILLAPGLKLWGKYIVVPDDAHKVEVVAQQWQWSYRYPGNDGVLGTAHVKHITPENPLGVNPDDPHSQDDVIIVGSELHLPVDKPVQVLMRSKDVIHNFYVPQFRAKMDIVPGLVSYLWLTPTKKGKYEVLCAELCGVGHYNMRSHVSVESAEDYEQWISQQTTFATLPSTVATDGETQANAGPSATSLVEQGRLLAQQRGCIACHTTDGNRGVGPTWLDLYGSTKELADGSTVVADDDYLAKAINQPNFQVVKDFPAIMPAAGFTKTETDAVIAFIKSISQ